MIKSCKLKQISWSGWDLIEVHISSHIIKDHDYMYFNLIELILNGQLESKWK